MTKIVDQTTILEGDRSRLRDLLRLRLYESGWNDQVRLLCHDVIRENHQTGVNVDKIVQEVTPKARQLVPDAIKKELLQKIKGILQKMEDVDDMK